MDIFFFISSVATILFLMFAIIIGLYVFKITKKIHDILNEIHALTHQIANDSKDVFAAVQYKMEQMSRKESVVERVVVNTLGTIFAKTFKSRDKIKKDVPKK